MPNQKLQPEQSQSDLKPDSQQELQPQGMSYTVKTAIFITLCLAVIAGGLLLLGLTVGAISLVLMFSLLFLMFAMRFPTGLFAAFLIILAIIFLVNIL